MSPVDMELFLIIYQFKMSIIKTPFPFLGGRGQGTGEFAEKKRLNNYPPRAGFDRLMSSILINPKINNSFFSGNWEFLVA
jgi:hypothetical protein